MSNYWIDGRIYGLAVQDDAPRVLSRSSDGKVVKYGYRGFTFKVERGAVLSWCHQGANRPGDLMALCHEAGWGSLSHRSCLRKVRRCIDKAIRVEARQIEADPSKHRMSYGIYGGGCSPRYP